MKRILITGASGFIGRHLAEELSSKRYKIYLLDVQGKESKSSPERFIIESISNFGQIKKLCAQVDGVVHLAAISRVSQARIHPKEAIDINAGGTLNLLEGIRLSRKKPWLILGSSCEVSFDWYKKENNGGFIKTANLYGMSKFISELLSFQYSKEYNLRVFVLRFSGVYGSVYDNHNKFLPKIILKALNNTRINIDNPVQSFDFIHYKDLVKGISLAIEHLDKNKSCPFFREVVLSTGRLTNLKELAELVVEKAGSSSRIKYGKSVFSKADNRVFINREKSQNNLGFKAQIPLEEGISLTIKHFRENNIAVS